MTDRRPSPVPLRRRRLAGFATGLRALYGTRDEAVPEDLADLARRLDLALAARGPSQDRGDPASGPADAARSDAAAVADGPAAVRGDDRPP